MPILPQVSKAIKMGLKSNPAASPQIVGSITAASSAITAAMTSIPAVPSPIPVIPTGQATSAIMTQIQAMDNVSAQQMAKITQKQIDQYNIDKEKAYFQQQLGKEKLHTDEKDAQAKIKEEDIPSLEEQISVLEEEIIQLEKTRKEEQSKYEAQVLEYKEKANTADSEGRIEERDQWIAKVSELDYWLAEIIQMIIAITNKKIEISSLERDLEDKQELANLQIKNDWTWLEEHATDFEVAVPNYPDNPDPPNLPATVPQPPQNMLAKAKDQVFAKWIAAPMIPAMGLSVAAIQIYIQSFQSNASPSAAAEAESQADAVILRMGGVI